MSSLNDSGRVYGLDSLIDAAISARKWRNVADPLRDWHRQLYEVLARLFAVEPLGGQEERRERLVDSVLDDMLDAVLESAAKSGTPFDGYLEIPSEACAVVRPHSSRLHELQQQTLAELRATARTLLMRRYPGIENREVSSSDLRNAGFDDSDEPDEDDYL